MSTREKGGVIGRSRFVNTTSRREGRGREGARLLSPLTFAEGGRKV